MSKHLLLLGLAACADLLDIPDHPALSMTSPDSTKVECEDSPLLHPPPPKSAHARVKVHACSFTSGAGCPEPVPNLSATLCNKLDVSCTKPVIEQTLFGDINGDFEFDVPTGGVGGQGFDGVLRITSPSGLCTDTKVFGAVAPAICGIVPDCDKDHPDEKCRVGVFIPSLVFFNPPVTVDMSKPIVVPLILNAASLGIIQAIDQKMTEGPQGFVFATVLDCHGEPASDVVLDLTLPPLVPVRKLYLSGGVISTATMTDDTGIGGLLGVPQGFKTVTAARMTDHGPESGIAGIKIEPQTGSYVSVILGPGSLPPAP